MLNESLFAAPSSRKLFDWLRWPLTLNPPVTLPKPPGVALPSWPPSAAGRRDDAGNQRAELREVAAVERQIDHLLPIDDDAERGVGGFDQRRLPCTTMRSSS